MMPMSIRMRLTLSYCVLLTITLGLLGASLFLVMKRGVYAATDEDLHTRLEGVRRLMERQIPKMSGEELREEFREHSGLRPGGDLLEVWDEHGEIVFQSASIRDYDIAMPTPSRRLEVENMALRDGPLRALNATIRIQDRPFIVLLATAVGPAQELITRFGWLLLWSIPAVLLLAALGGYWMSRRALAPVDQITRTARSIGAHNLTQRLAILNTGDELQRLSETLNEMVARLQSSFQKITQFTADASHELRTPIALIRATAELALRRRREEKDYRESLTQILDEAERTSLLIESLMVLARADSESEVLQLSGTNLTEVVQDSFLQGRRLADARAVHLTAGIPEVDLIIEANAPALRRLLLILIDNAVKYTAEGKDVTISLGSDGKVAIVNVQDSGIGISPEDLPHIFERFYRADKARSRDVGGAGLGLSIAKWIADAHETVIEVSSVPEKGSIFNIRFLLSENAVRAAASD